eukprot:gene1291-1683_t
MPLATARGDALDHCLVGHCSSEPGHRRLLERLGKQPLLDLEMRLGEGSGAMAAVPLVAMACAGITEVDEDVQGGLPAIGPLAALQFLTRLPVRLRRAPDMAAMVVWFPLAGAVIGALAGGVGALAFQWTAPLVAGALAVTVGLLVTGAFHEDGLGDIADAFGGGYTVERRLEIMKDSRHGTYGVAAMSASIVVRVVALGSMPSGATLFASAVAAHVIA